MNRHQAAQAYKDALTTWINVLLTDLTGIADRLDIAGPNVVVAFHPSIPEDFDPTTYVDPDYREFDDCEEPQDGPDIDATLGGVVISNGADEAYIDPSIGGELWADCVDVWSALREAMTQRYRTYTASGLVIDLTGRNVAVWSPLYCPDFGPLPDTITCLDEFDLDPFQALLIDEDEVLDRAEARITGLMETYRLAVPSIPAHTEGECSG